MAATFPYEADVALIDGSTALLRTARPADRPGLLALMEGLSTESLYFRFFMVPRNADREVDRLLRGKNVTTLVADARTRLLGVASYVRCQEEGDSAEVAFAVADDVQGHGIGTKLLSGLADLATLQGLRRFSADVLGDNHRMLQLFRDSGFGIQQTTSAGVCHLSLDLAATPAREKRSALRAQVSASASIGHFFQPRSVVVVGASRHRGKIGAEVLHNLAAFGFPGTLFAVHPVMREIQGVATFPNVTALPEAPDLAIICVPAKDVRSVVGDCIKKGVKSVVVLTAGFGETGESGRELEAQLLRDVRDAGIRMVGPNCMGLLNTATRLNATFSPVTPPAGRVAMLSQSGALGLAILEHARRLEIGLSTFVSVGNKTDVSGNDLLQYWEQDPNTDIILLYLESFGNPRKFSQVARRLARTKPIVAVKAGRSHVGARAAASHTGALAASDTVVDALLHQCGVIRTDTMEELFDVTRVLAQQPVPRGRRVAILTNAGGPGILAADACAARGLDVTELSPETMSSLRELLPAAASVMNPVDMIATASPQQYERALTAVLRDEHVDGAIVIFISPAVTAGEDIATAVARARLADTTKPVLAVFMGSEPAAELLKPVPAFVFPEAAVAALSRVAKYGEWRASPAGTIPEFTGIDLHRARRVVTNVLDRGGGWATPREAARLLSSIGIDQARGTEAASEEQAVEAAQAIGYPVALKAFGPDIVHKTERKAVQLDLADAASVRKAFGTFKSSLGTAMSGVLVQEMVDSGVEMLVGSIDDPSFGPVIACGFGGTLAEVVADTAFRIAPLTNLDAESMIQGLRCARLLQGYRGGPAADIRSLQEVVLRLSALVVMCPEIHEIEINPLRVLQEGARALDVRVRIAAPAVRPGLRRVEY